MTSQIKYFSLFSFAALTLLMSLPAFAAEPDIRSCLVKDTLKGGMYVYILCDESGKDIWMATVARAFKTSEKISFINAPPMINFYSKALDRTFPEVIFTDLLPPEAKK